MNLKEAIKASATALAPVILAAVLLALVPTGSECKEIRHAQVSNKLVYD